MSGDIEIDPTEVTPNASTFQVDLPHITESSPAAASNADPSSPAPTPTKDVRPPTRFTDPLNRADRGRYCNDGLRSHAACRYISVLLFPHQ